MDITQLRYFLVTAETLNYTKAANQLYISRQALRQALSSMENELSVTFFTNQKNKLFLTAEGEYLRDTGAQLLRSYDEMVQGLQLLGKEKSTFSLAFSESLFPFIAPEWDDFARQFQKQYPSSRLNITHLSSDAILEALYADELTCGFLMQMPWERPGFTMDVCARYDVEISCRENHPVLQTANFTLKNLADYPCIGMGSPKEIMHPLYQKCQKENIDLQYEVIPECLDAFYRIEHSDTLGFNLVKGGIPDHAATPGIPLSGFQWEIGLLYRNDSPKLRDIRMLSRFMRAAHGQISR